MTANQNSISPKFFTEGRFSSSRATITVSAGMKAGPPVFDVAGNRDDVRDIRDDPEEPVRPADEEAGAQTEDVGNEVGEGLVLGVESRISPMARRTKQITLPILA